ncbi:hypothetical protein NHQ30_010221 [Ciborinia camelliae]|nr:hypothetical protein NHQ30_010221 [Ciborinia camelliae]
MASSLEDKTVLVTGAGSGIGRSTAIKLSSLGAIVLLCDSDMRIFETRLLCRFRDRHPIYTFDISDSQACDAIIEKLIFDDAFTINHVFNCAGVNPAAIPITEVTDEYCDKLINTNLKGTFNITRAVAPHLAPGSSIVNVSSICGIVPVSHYSVYCATKYAIIGFSKCMALELGPKGIRTNVVAPGYINTPTNASVVEGEEAVRRIEGTVSMGRYVISSQITDFILSDTHNGVAGGSR